MTERKRSVSDVASLASVIVAVLIFHLYFFSLSLPNSGTPEHRVSRTLVWQVALGLTDLPMPAIDALQQMGNVESLCQRISIVGYATLIVVAAIGMGVVMLRSVGVTGVERASVGSAAEQSGAARSVAAAQFSLAEWLVFAYGLGMSLGSLATLAIGLAGAMNRPLVVVTLVGLSCSGGFVIWKSLSARGGGRGGQRLNAARSLDAPSRLTFEQQARFAAGIAVAGLFLTISLLGAMLPASDFDVREYHLQGPKEFFQARGITFMPHNVYANMPFGTEMLSLLAMIVAGDWWWGALVGQTVLATFSAATALGVFALARRLFGPAAGGLAALVYLTTPWVYRISIIPYTENALCFYLLAGTLAVVLAIQSAEQGGPTRCWWLAGVMAGSAAACKYPALISTVLPLGLTSLVFPMVRRWFAVTQVAEPSQSDSRLAIARPSSVVRPAIIFAVGVALAFGPWLARNWIVTGNPFYPLLYGVFGGRNWTPEKNAKWEWGHRVSLLVVMGVQRPPAGKSANPNDPQHALTLRRLGENVQDVVAQADWQSPLVFALAPLALVGRPRGVAAWLWLFVAYLFAQWWLLTHRLDRFWVPLLPIVAALAGAGAVWTDDVWWRRFRTLVVGLCVFYNFSFAATGLCGNNNYAARLDSTRRDPTDELVNEMNDNLPQSARVLAVGAADLFHLDRPVVYNTVFDDSIFERLTRDRTPREAAAELTELGVTHVYVNWLEVARYREPWSYGFTEYVTPGAFERLVAAGYLRRMPLPPGRAGPPVSIGREEAPGHELFEVVQEERSP